ncbi:hypothetical protein KDA11_05075, partial [Candidatus Saccharibacteria bacterium]|nr:hypothetical protein [Candidatus Saccharibacteria bacterium]
PMSDPMFDGIFDDTVRRLALNSYPRGYIEKMNSSIPESERMYTSSPNLDEQVLSDWLACYGFKIRYDEQGNITGAARGEYPYPPDHLTQTNADDRLKIQYSHNFNLAEAHINWYLHLQRQLGIEQINTFSEGQFDKLLLANGGLEIFRSEWTLIIDALEAASNLNLVSIKLDKPEVRRAAPFNLEYGGIRYDAYFNKRDDSQLDLYSRQHGVQEAAITLDDVFSDVSEWSVSLGAVERVVLYSLAGVAGHITGGGSAYNYDALQVMQVLNLPYMPLWWFPKKDQYDRPMTPVIWPTLANKEWRNLQTLGSNGAGNQTSDAILQNTLEGNYSLLDLAMSTDPQEAHMLMQEHIQLLSTGQLDRFSQLSLPNRAGVTIEQILQKENE